MMMADDDDDIEDDDLEDEAEVKLLKILFKKNKKLTPPFDRHLPGQNGIWMKFVA